MVPGAFLVRDCVRMAPVGGAVAASLSAVEEGEEGEAAEFMMAWSVKLWTSQWLTFSTPGRCRRKYVLCSQKEVVEPGGKRFARGEPPQLDRSQRWTEPTVGTGKKPRKGNSHLSIFIDCCPLLRRDRETSYNS